MSISGLVITLTDDPAEALAALTRVRVDGRFELGERHRHVVPVVLQAASDIDAQEAVAWLSQLQGVRKVDVAYVKLADEALAA